MRNIEQAKRDWESATRPATRHIRRSKRREVDEPFRGFEEAEAWVEWSNNCELKKIESHSPGTGAGTNLLRLLQEICFRHGVQILANALAYEPDINVQATGLPQEELVEWYIRHGFVAKIIVGVQ